MTKSFEEIGQEIGRLVGKKNTQYGDSYVKAGKIVDILYPGGVKEGDQDALVVIRVIDKLFRIANGNGTPLDESNGNENAWVDIAGYAIAMVKYKEERYSDGRGHIRLDQTESLNCGNCDYFRKSYFDEYFGMCLKDSYSKPMSYYCNNHSKN